MFNKLISNLPFNPSLLEQVGFYARRVKQEESLRKMGLMFVGLTMFIQVFAVLIPPQQSLAASDSNIMVGGGASTKDGILAKYDSDNWVRTVYAQFFNITRDDIVKMQDAYIHMTPGGGYTGYTTVDAAGNIMSQSTTILTAGRRPNGSAGEQQQTVTGGADPTFIYEHTLVSAFRTSPVHVLACSKDACGRFKAIGFDCGNPIMDTSDTPTPPPPPPPPPAPPTPPPITPAPPRPFASCNGLVVLTPQVQVNTSVRVTVSGSAGAGATIKNYTVDFGDGSAPVLVTIMDTTGSQVAQSHVYTKEGTYTIKGTVNASIGSYSSPSCQGQVVVKPVPPPCPYDSSLLASDVKCQPCAENPQIPASDKVKCAAVTTKGKNVANLTQQKDDADGTTAASNDILKYTLTTTNKSKALAATDYVVAESVADILDYATPQDLDGGTLGSDGIVKWPATTINPGTSVLKTMTFKVKDPIPATNVPKSDGGTFDLKLINTYGNTVTINVNPPPAKVIEQTTTSLPNTGPGASLIIGFFATALIAYFYMRSRLITKELELVRAEYASGGGF